MTHEIQGACLVDGGWHKQANRPTFQATNPATGEALPTSFAEAEPSCMNDAAVAATEGV